MEPGFDHIGIAIFFGIFLITMIVAIWKGAGPERAGAAILAFAFVLQAAAYALVPPAYLNVDLVSVTVDFICFGGLAVVAIYARRIWPIWASSLQLLSLAAHFARQVQVEVEPLVYSIMKTTPTGGALILILVGTLVHQTKIKRFGFDQSWMNWPHLEKVKLRDATKEQSRFLCGLFKN